MKYVCTFSGGFDSTMCIINTLKDLKDEDTLDLIVIKENLGGTPKCKREDDSREKILKWIGKKYPKYIDQLGIMELDVMITTHGKWGRHQSMHRTGLVQPIWWLGEALTIIAPGSTLRLGYIKGDDAMNSERMVQDIADAMLRLRFYLNTDGKTIKIEFPMKCHTKSDVLHMLYEEDPALIDMCTSCENYGPDDKCRDCNPCNHLRSAIINLLIGNIEGEPLLTEKERAFFEERLYRWFGYRCHIQLPDDKKDSYKKEKLQEMTIGKKLDQFFVKQKEEMDRLIECSPLDKKEINDE